VPVSQPTEIMRNAWGPFARQCITVEVFHYETAHSEFSENNTTCTSTHFARSLSRDSR
jgi:hypothetical protein